MEEVSAASAADDLDALVRKVHRASAVLSREARDHAPPADKRVNDLYVTMPAVPFEASLPTSQGLEARAEAPRPPGAWPGSLFFCFLIARFSLIFALQNQSNTNILEIAVRFLQLLAYHA